MNVSALVKWTVVSVSLFSGLASLGVSLQKFSLAEYAVPSLSGGRRSAAACWLPSPRSADSA